jgi:HemY protein
MVRIVLFLALVLALGFGFSWFADRPGMVTLTWEGSRYQTSLMVVLAGLTALVATIMVCWWTVSVILRSPSLMRRFYRNRRRDRGYLALSQGLIAASSGDKAKARKLARDSRKLLGDEALVRLLDAQTLLLEGERAEARDRFTAMLENDETKLVALRGLFLEAEREGEKEASRHFAEEALKRSPALPWASSAMLRYHAGNGDFEAALRLLESARASGLVDKADADRKRAVLLTAQAMTEEPAAPDKAAKLAQQALKLAPRLAPAAVTAAISLARSADFRKAARLLEDAWRQAPHREIAQTYVMLRSGDTAAERLARARRLSVLQPADSESVFTVAEAAIAAREWDQAREALKPLIASHPSERTCLLMAAIEEGEHSDKGRARDWLARALRAPRDPAWVADGIVSDRWLPVSPVTGEIDAFEWKVPVPRLGSRMESSDPVVQSGTTDSDFGAVVEPETAVDSKPAEVAGDVAPAPSAVTPVGLAVPAAPDDPGVDPQEPEETRKAFRLF